MDDVFLNVTPWQVGEKRMEHIPRRFLFNRTELEVLWLEYKGELGYLAAQQEWVDDHGEPLEDAHQSMATFLAIRGWLPRFEEWFPLKRDASPPSSSVDEGNTPDE